MVTLAKINPGPTFSREEKMRVRTLYLVKRLQSAEIAEKLGKDPRQITNLVNKMGLAKRRREMEDKAARAAEDKAIVDAQDFIESVAVRGEELTHKGFDLADGAADKGDALAFSAAMSGTKTAVALTRQALGIDAIASAQGQGITINAIFARPSDSSSEPRQVEPVRCIESANTSESENETDLDFA